MGSHSLSHLYYQSHSHLRGRRDWGGGLANSSGSVWGPHRTAEPEPQWAPKSMTPLVTTFRFSISKLILGIRSVPDPVLTDYTILGFKLMAKGWVGWGLRNISHNSTRWLFSSRPSVTEAPRYMTIQWWRPLIPGLLTFLFPVSFYQYLNIKF